MFVFSLPSHAKYTITYTFIVDRSKILARRPFIDQSNSYFYWFILEPKYFLLIDFRSCFSTMFLFYVFSWLVEKYKSVI